MSNKVYDVLKWLCLVFIPALITFVGVIFNALNIENAQVILTIAIGFNTFLGSILGISNINYKKLADFREETTNGIGEEDEE